MFYKFWNWGKGVSEIPSLGSQKQKLENFLLTDMIELFETNRMSYFPPFYDNFFL